MEEIMRLRQGQEELVRRIDENVDGINSRTEQNRAQIGGILTLLQAAVNRTFSQLILTAAI
jgi:hypothetical protein